LTKYLHSAVRTAVLLTGTALCALALSLVDPTSLQVQLDGDYLRIAAPRLNFLSGKPLERLKDGASVAFIAQLTITTSPTSLAPVARSVARFAFSYDIWEERFSVAKIGPKPDSRRTVSHLSAQTAEDWCFENLVVDRSQIPPDKPFYIQLDLRAEDPQDQLSFLGDPGINITRLIEIFGRPGRPAQPRWTGTSGPWRIADLRKEDLKKNEIKGTRG
jgi:hypothetical protein